MTRPGCKTEWRRLGLRWLKFSSVGILGVGVQLGMLALLAGLLKLDYLIATALAVEAAVLHNFFWHQRWTWRDRAAPGRSAVFARLLRFNLNTGGLSIVGNLALMSLLVGKLHLPFLAANCLCIGALSLLNFLVSDRLVFVPVFKISQVPNPCGPVSPQTSGEG